MPQCEREPAVLRRQIYFLRYSLPPRLSRVTFHDIDIKVNICQFTVLVLCLFLVVDASYYAVCAVWI